MEEVRKINRRGQIVCVVTYKGIEYKRYPNGKHANYYCHKWKENGKYHSVLLHHAIWEEHNGKIPDGYVIHHRDKNPFNNDIENLQLVTPSEHALLHQEKLDLLKRSVSTTAKYSKENWQERREKAMARLQSEKRICGWCGNEYTATNVHQRFCSKLCHHRWQYRAPENNIEMVCKCCGKTFLGNKYLKQKYCSRECAYTLSRNAARRNLRGLRFVD